MFILRCVKNASVCRHHLGANQHVATQPDLVREPPQTAAQCQASNTSVTDESAGHGQPVRLRCCVEFGPCGATTACCDTGIRINRDGPHQTQVDRQPTVTQRTPSKVVSTTSHGDFDRMALAPRECNGHVSRARAPHRGGRSLPNGSVPNVARRHIPIFAWQTDRAGHSSAKLGERNSIESAH